MHSPQVHRYFYFLQQFTEVFFIYIRIYFNFFFLNQGPVWCWSSFWAGAKLFPVSTQTAGPPTRKSGSSVAPPLSRARRKRVTSGSGRAPCCSKRADRASGSDGAGAGPEDFGLFSAPQHTCSSESTGGGFDDTQTETHTSQFIASFKAKQTALWLVRKLDPL